MSGLFSISTEDDFVTDFEGITYRDYDGLLPSSFISSQNSKWETYVMYFYERPQLGEFVETAKGQTLYPAKSNRLLNRKVYAQRVSSVVDVTTPLPGPLKTLPTMRTRELDDRTILNTVVPQGKWSFYPDTGKPKPSNTMYQVVGLAKPGTGEMVISVINIGVRDYEKLARRLAAIENSSQEPVTGLPWKVERTSGGKLEVTAFANEPAQVMEMDTLMVHDTDVTLLEQHVDALRYHYEEFLLENGWDCDEQTHSSGVVLRRNWHLGDALDVPFTPDRKTPAMRAAAPDTVDTSQLERLAKLDMGALRRLLSDKGVDVPDKMTRKSMIALLSI